MAAIATYVFLDLETTGLPSEEFNKTKITELSLVAVKRDHILETRRGSTPRVLHKLTRCFNPGRRITEGSSDITGLDNFLLEHESYFDAASFDMINNFLNTLTKPVCLIAHNGLNFDFPILKRQLDMLNVGFSDDILCADSLEGFRDILEVRKEVSSDALKDEVDLSSENCLSMQSVNETTPKQAKKILKRPYAGRAKQRLPFSSEKKLKESYKLSDIYGRVLGRPAMEAHRAESDCMLALEIAVALSEEFVSWVDVETNHLLFREVSPMSPGLLVLTGALWGCTNPFIRRGTRGLRAVRADSWAGQARAELCFLLGNWRYVAPWLVNQLGSLAYLLAVRRAPLSLAVPAANGLAFAATAATGALAGIDKPLDRGSILGIALIVAGTALCCWDQVD